MSNTEASLGLAPISHIKANLDRVFGPGVWAGWEPETIALEFNMPLDELTLDKISILQLMHNKPKMIFTDISFFLWATEVINNKVAEFDYFPVPTSLELAYAIKQIEAVTGQKITKEVASSGVAEAVSYVLVQEGYSEPVAPFDFVDAGKLSAGQTKADTEAKRSAIAAYIKHMGEA